MPKRIIKLGDKADLIIEEPSSLPSANRALVVASAVLEGFKGSNVLRASSHSGSLPITIGYSVFKVYYRLRVKRVLSALEAYSEAIRHIENNFHLYDARLARKAIEVLKECHRRELR